MKVGVFFVTNENGVVGVVSPLSHGVGFKKGLPPEAVLGTVPPDIERILPSNFTVNPVFIEFLQGFIAQHTPALPEFIEEAQRQQDGYVYVIDYRTPDLQGDVPAEDILGAFEVKSGEPVLYETNPNYRLLTERGFIVLHPKLEAMLLAELGALAVS